MILVARSEYTTGSEYSSVTSKDIINQSSFIVHHHDHRKQQQLQQQ
jgi:hypothetical protein